MKEGGLELDLDVLPKYAEYLAAKNITNIMPAGSNGESLSLSVGERIRLAEAWAKVVTKHGIKLYMHIGSESLVDTIALARHAANTTGVTGIVAMTPVYFKPSVESLGEFLAQVAAAAPETPFWFYHFPDDTGVLPGQAHAFLQWAETTKKIPNLMGIKFTDYNLMDFQMCTQVGHLGKYNMLFGRDEMALSALDMYADAAVSSTVQFSRSLRDVISLYAKGDRKGALAAQEVNAKLCTKFGRYAGDLNVQKNIMKMAGMNVGPSRLPKRDLSEEDYKSLFDELTSEKLIDVPSEQIVL